MDAFPIRRAAVSERGALEALQWRASLENPEYREALLAHPDAIELPASQIEAGGVYVCGACPAKSPGSPPCCPAATGTPSLTVCLWSPAFGALGSGAGSSSIAPRSPGPGCSRVLHVTGKSPRGALLPRLWLPARWPRADALRPGATRTRFSRHPSCKGDCEAPDWCRPRKSVVLGKGPIHPCRSSSSTEHSSGARPTTSSLPHRSTSSPATTKPGYALYHLEGYPGMVADPGCSRGDRRRGLVRRCQVPEAPGQA